MQDCNIPLLMHWSYCNIVLNHPYIFMVSIICLKIYLSACVLLYMYLDITITAHNSWQYCMYLIYIGKVIYPVIIMDFELNVTGVCKCLSFLGDFEWFLWHILIIGHPRTTLLYEQYIVGLVQERRNSIANALELHLSGTNPSICNT